MAAEAGASPRQAAATALLRVAAPAYARQAGGRGVHDHRRYGELRHKLDVALRAGALDAVSGS